jgi:pilus assembly protein Flp/PilA
MQTISRLVRDRAGTMAMEYGLIAGLISLAVIAGATLTGGVVGSMFTAIGTAIAAALGAITG